VETHLTVATISYSNLSNLQALSGFLVLVLVFFLREFASGALKKAGEEFWVWARHRHSGGQTAWSELDDSTGAGGHAEVGRCSSEHIESGVDDDRPLR
jgi:hypothetical protein